MDEGGSLELHYHWSKV